MLKRALERGLTVKLRMTTPLTLGKYDSIDSLKDCANIIYLWSIKPDGHVRVEYLDEHANQEDIQAILDLNG